MERIRKIISIFLLWIASGLNLEGFRLDNYYMVILSFILVCMSVYGIMKEEE